VEAKVNRIEVLLNLSVKTPTVSLLPLLRIISTPGLISTKVCVITNTVLTPSPNGGVVTVRCLPDQLASKEGVTYLAVSVPASNSAKVARCTLPAVVSLASVPIVQPVLCVIGLICGNKARIS